MNYRILLTQKYLNIRLENIERITFVESSPKEFGIFISALGSKYLYIIVETLQEAERLCRGLIQDIENIKSEAK